MIMEDQLIQVTPRIQSSKDMTLGVFISSDKPYYVPVPFGSITDLQALQDVEDEIRWLQDKIDTLRAWVEYFNVYLTKKEPLGGSDH